MAPWWLHSGNDEAWHEDEAPGAGDDAVATTAVPLAAEDFARQPAPPETAGEDAAETDDPETEAEAEAEAETETEAPAPKRRRHRRRRKPASSESTTAREPRAAPVAERPPVAPAPLAPVRSETVAPAIPEPVAAPVAGWAVGRYRVEIYSTEEGVERIVDGSFDVMNLQP